MLLSSPVSVLLLLRNGEVSDVLDSATFDGLDDLTEEVVVADADLGLKLYSLVALALLLCLSGGRTVLELSFDGDSRLLLIVAVSGIRLLELVVDSVMAAVIAVLHVTEDKAFFTTGGGVVDVRMPQPLSKATAILSCCFFLSNIAA